MRYYQGISPGTAAPGAGMCRRGLPFSFTPLSLFDLRHQRLLDFHRSRTLGRGGGIVNTLRIPLTNIPDHGVQFDQTASVASFQPPGAEAVPVEQVTVHGSMTPAGGEYLFQGQVEGVFVHPCDRCLESARIPFALEVFWAFQEGTTPVIIGMDPDDDDLEDEVDIEDAADVHLFQGGEIDLAPVVWEELALSVPSKYVCAEDCRGLCPRCGVDLNRGACTCEVRDTEAPEKNQAFAALRDLFPDLPQQKNEE